MLVQIGARNKSHHVHTEMLMKILNILVITATQSEKVIGSIPILKCSVFMLSLCPLTFLLHVWLVIYSELSVGVSMIGSLLYCLN